jgi:hypothetical protein
MSEVKEIKIKCLNQGCERWFPSPISFGDTGSFSTSMLVGNIVNCPYCGSMTPCNKENMKVRAKDSGFVGKDT